MKKNFKQEIKKNLGQSEPGLSLGLYEPDPLVNINLPEGLMVVEAPKGYNSTDICMELCVRDGKLSAQRLVLNNYDGDPSGREEAPGSADEAREQGHYTTVMGVVAAFLGAGEPEGVVEDTSKAATPDEEGEALDDVDAAGKKRTPKEASVEVALA